MRQVHAVVQKSLMINRDLKAGLRTLIHTSQEVPFSLICYLHANQKIPKPLEQDLSHGLVVLETHAKTLILHHPNQKNVKTLQVFTKKQSVLNTTKRYLSGCPNCKEVRKVEDVPQPLKSNVQKVLAVVYQSLMKQQDSNTRKSQLSSILMPIDQHPARQKKLPP